MPKSERWHKKKNQPISYYELQTQKIFNKMPNHATYERDYGKPITGGTAFKNAVCLAYEKQSM